MTRREIYDAYLEWLGDSKPKSYPAFWECDFTNCNILEDSERVINRLFYVVPDFSNNLLRCFIFFEENEFREDEDGNFILVHSSWHLQDNN